MPRMIADRVGHEVEPNGHGSDRRPGHEQAQPRWPKIEDIAGIDRHQRRRPAQQHRKQVQRHRTKDDLFRPDITEPCIKRGPAGAPGRFARCGLGDAKHKHCRNHEESHRHAVGQLCRQPVKQAPGQRPTNPGQMVRR